MTVSNIQRLMDKMNRGEPAIGVLNMSCSVELVEILAHMGFDFIYADQMFTTIGWKELGDMVRAAQGRDMAVFARIENDLWHSADDPGVASRVARALAVGVDGVKVNVYSKNEARWAVDADAGWLRDRTSRVSSTTVARLPSSSSSTNRSAPQARSLSLRWQANSLSIRSTRFSIFPACVPLVLP